MKFKELLETEHFNSRFVYLVTSMTVCFCVLALVLSAIWKGVPGNALVLDAYIYLVGVLLSGGLAGAAGRWMTNKKALQPPVESSETITTTVEKSVKAAKPVNTKIL